MLPFLYHHSRYSLCSTGYFIGIDSSLILIFQSFFLPLPGVFFNILMFMNYYIIFLSSFWNAVKLKQKSPPNPCPKQPPPPPPPQKSRAFSCLNSCKILCVWQLTSFRAFSPPSAHNFGDC